MASLRELRFFSRMVPLFHIGIVFWFPDPFQEASGGKGRATLQYAYTTKCHQAIVCGKTFQYVSRKVTNSCDPHCIIAIQISKLDCSEPFLC